MKGDAPSRQAQASPSPGLYVHLPFCHAKCPYCDFAVALLRPGRPETYVDALLAEAALLATPADPNTLADVPNDEHGPHVPNGIIFATVFFGGGTPTTTPLPTFQRLHEGLGRIHDLSQAAETTCEANPEGLDVAYLRGLRDTGVNRLSIGMQSADAAELARLGRRHAADDVRRALQLARRAGFDNVSVDLMFGLPGQTLDTWRATLDFAVALGVEHISAYGLQVEDGTPFSAWQTAGRLTVPDGDAQAEMYEILRERLLVAGYVHYEISNFALPGRESRHNLLYWENGDYLGLGVGAHSHWTGVTSVPADAPLGATEPALANAQSGRGTAPHGWRWGNTKNLRVYREAIRERRAPFDPDVTYPVSGSMEIGDAMMLGLRRTAGVRFSEMRARYGVDPRERWADDLKELADRRLIRLDADSVRLSEAGRLLGNLVFERFVQT